MATFRFPVLTGLIGVTACVPPPEPATSQTSAYYLDCGEFACGQNGALLAGVPFYGLWLTGDENEEHVSYHRYAPSWDAIPSGPFRQLDVDGGRLRVWAAGDWRYGPLWLEGGILEVALSGKVFYVKIAKVNSGIASGTDAGEPFWTRDGIAGPDDLNAESYQLQWADPKGPLDTDGEPRFEDVCPHRTLPSDLWHNQIDAVIFEGEKYDLETKEIKSAPTEIGKAWFNIACAGSSPAKQYLMRRTTASAVPPTYVSTIDNDRQAMLRALAAEYCGNGVNFTRTGRRLRIQDHLPFSDGQGWLPREDPFGFTDDQLDDGTAILEAVWDAHGAVCLQTPRLLIWDPPVGSDPEIEKHIREDCKERPPKCTDLSWYPTAWTRHGQLRTAIPL